MGSVSVFFVGRPKYIKFYSVFRSKHLFYNKMFCLYRGNNWFYYSTVDPKIIREPLKKYFLIDNCEHKIKLTKRRWYHRSYGSGKFHFFGEAEFFVEQKTRLHKSSKMIKLKFQLEADIPSALQIVKQYWFTSQKLITANAVDVLKQS